MVGQAMPLHATVAGQDAQPPGQRRDYARVRGQETLLGLASPHLVDSE